MATGERTPEHIRQPPAKEVVVWQKRMKAAELRRAGWKWDDVAAEAGYSNGWAAARAVKEFLHATVDQAYGEAALYRAESIDRLTGLLKVQWERALDGDDKATTQCRLLINQIDDLTGAKAPIKMEIGESDVDRLLRESLAELNRRAARDGGEADADQAGAAYPG